MKTCMARMCRQLAKPTCLQGLGFRFSRFPSLRTTHGYQEEHFRRSTHPCGPKSGSQTTSETNAQNDITLKGVIANLGRYHRLPRVFYDFHELSINQCPCNTYLVLPGFLRWLMRILLHKPFSWTQESQTPHSNLKIRHLKSHHIATAPAEAVARLRQHHSGSGQAWPKWPEAGLMPWECCEEILTGISFCATFGKSCAWRSVTTKQRMTDTQLSSPYFLMSSLGDICFAAHLVYDVAPDVVWIHTPKGNCYRKHHTSNSHSVPCKLEQFLSWEEQSKHEKVIDNGHL